MKRLILMSALLVAACDTAPTPPKTDAAKGPATAGPPPPPPYQMRDELPAGDRLASAGDGATLFSNRCGSCHLAGGMGTNMVTVQQIKAGQPPLNGLLANRKDLTIGYVKTVVRQGKVAMPRLSRTEVTDAELDAIAAYLGKAGA